MAGFAKRLNRPVVAAKSQWALDLPGATSAPLRKQRLPSYLRASVARAGGATRVHAR